MLIGWTVLGLAAFLAAYLGIRLMLNSISKRHLLDIPNARSSHSVPTPSGGGLWIAAVTLGGLLLVGLSPLLSWNRFLIAFAIGAGLVGTVSLFDDYYDLSYRFRIIAQAAAAAVIIAFGVDLGELALPVVGTVHFGWLGIPLAFLFIVGLTNTYNFMDGIDGLAGLQAVIAGFFLMVLGWSARDNASAAVALLIGSSSLGFLAYNWPPARIFMGDVGSTFLGFSFAALILNLTDHDPRFFTLGVLVLWPFLFDSAFTFLRRLTRRENVFEAHRCHLYQQLVDHGYNHVTVTLTYGMLSIVGMGLGVAWYFGYINLAVPLVVTSLAVALVLFSKRIAPILVEHNAK